MATEEQTVGGVIAAFAGGVNWDRVGQKLTITNRVVSKLSFKTIRVGSPTGTITMTIRTAADQILATKLWGSAGSVSLAAEWIEATFDTPVFVNEEVRILMEWGGTLGSGSDYLGFYATADVKADEYYTRYYGGYIGDSGAGGDATYIYTYATGSSGGYLFPTDAITRVTNLIHRYNRNQGVYTLEMNLGEVTTDFGLPEWAAKPLPSVPPVGPPKPPEPPAIFPGVLDPAAAAQAAMVGAGTVPPPPPPTPLRVEPSPALLRTLDIQKTEARIAMLQGILDAPASSLIWTIAAGQMRDEKKYLKYLKAQ